MLGTRAIFESILGVGNEFVVRHLCWEEIDEVSRLFDTGQAAK